MGVPCTPVSTVDVAAGDGIDVSFLGGTYTVSLDADTLSALSYYKVYATEAARDLDNPSPSSGDAAWSQADDRLWWHDGTGWVIMREPEQTYTPTYANVTLGTSPTRTGTYRRSNGLIYHRSRLVLGTGGSFTGQPTISMPSGVTLDALDRGIGRVQLNDTGTQTYGGVIANAAAGGSVITPIVNVNSGTYETHLALSSTVPFTWTTADELMTCATWLPMETMYL